MFSFSKFEGGGGPNKLGGEGVVFREKTTRIFGHPRLVKL